MFPKKWRGGVSRELTQILYDNTKIDVGLIRRKDVKWIKVAYDSINNIVMNLLVP
jgi:hypothetical protein